MILDSHDSLHSAFSRPLSTMSIPFIDVAFSVRRTRIKFKEPQLAMLEDLFRQNSHPSRQNREKLARELGM